MGYNEFHLTDLRRFARKIGVKSPTKYNKDKLIEKIIEIEKGIEEPFYSKKGRPVKAKKPVETIVVTDDVFKDATDNSHVDSDIVCHAIKRTKEFLIQLEKEIEEIKKSKP